MWVYLERMRELSGCRLWLWFLGMMIAYRLEENLGKMEYQSVCHPYPLKGGYISLSMRQ